MSSGAFEPEHGKVQLNQRLGGLLGYSSAVDSEFHHLPSTPLGRNETINKSDAVVWLKRRI